MSDVTTFRRLYELARPPADRFHTVAALRAHDVQVRRSPDPTLLLPGPTWIVDGADAPAADGYSYRGPVTQDGHQLGFAITDRAGGLLLLTDALLAPAAPVTVGGRTDRLVALQPGTAISVPGSTIAVEALADGDLVCLWDGAPAPVRRVAERTASALFADALHVDPIRICAGALSDQRPRRDLLLSPDCALLLNHALIQAGALVNDTSIRRESSHQSMIAYHQVVLDMHSLIIAEGVVVETYCDTAQLTARVGDPADLTAADDFFAAEMDLPRAKSHRQVPYAVREQVRARAG